MDRDTPLWRTAPPLWPDALEGPVAFDAPAILRFDSDDFMDRLQGLLSLGGAGMADHVAANETWRGPAAGLSAGGAGPVKLYQPVHGRFYLVAASLVCARYWLPDKRIDAAVGETVSFVIRQLRPATAGTTVDPADPATYVELGWVPSGHQGTWQAPLAGDLAPGEQRHPLFALQYRDSDRDRRLLAGLIPVSGREAFEAGRGAPTAPPTAPDPLASLSDPRLGALSAVVGGLQALRATAIAVAGGTGPANPPSDGEMRESLYFGLLDLAAFLKEHLPRVWNESSGPSPAELALLDDLRAADEFAPDVTWLQALRTCDAGGPAAAAGPTDPQPVAGMGVEAIGDAIGAIGVEVSDPLGGSPVDPAETTFFERVAAAIPPPPAAPPTPAPPPPFRGGVAYVIRCVYERPRCGPSQRLTVGRPSAPFTLAQFFDPDAPFRPTRIPTPIDTSLEGLRKHPKSVSVSISRALRQQMERIQGIRLSNLDSGNLPSEPSLNFGMVCQLSFPIITICALVLLMIMVTLLNIVFWWLPFFKICLPRVEDG